MNKPWMSLAIVAVIIAGVFGAAWLVKSAKNGDVPALTTATSNPITVTNDNTPNATPSNSNPTPASNPAPAQQGPVTKLVITDTKVGTGAVAAQGSTVFVDYTGMLLDGTVFDTSKVAGREPLSFVVGSGMVVPGFDQGVAGMKVGGSRHVLIPSAMAYGARGQGPIPPNSPLIFDITLVSVK